MLSEENANKLNSNEVTNQAVQLGTAVRRGIVVLPFEVTADATSGLTIPVPVGIEITGFKVQCRATSGGGTLTLRNGTNAITDAVVCAVDTTMAEAGTIDDTYSTIAKDSTSLNVISANVGDMALILVEGIAI